MCGGNPEDKHTHSVDCQVEQNNTLSESELTEDWSIKPQSCNSISTQHSEMDTDIRDGGSVCRFVAMFCQKHPKPKHATATSPKKSEAKVSQLPPGGWSQYRS